MAANICDTLPVIGAPIKRMLLAGDEYNEQTLPRFFILHAAALPAVMILLLAIHIGILRLHGISEMQFADEADKPGPKHFNFFPDHFYTELLVGLVLIILLSVLASTLPAELGPKADPLTTPEVIKPEWWFYVSFRWLKLFSGTFAVLSSDFIVFLMFVWPLIDGWIRVRWKSSEASVWVGIAAVLALVGLTVWEAIVEH